LPEAETAESGRLLADKLFASSTPQSGPAGLLVFHKEGAAFGDGQLFTIRPNGTHSRQLTHGPTSSVNAD
jgi:hypothetical protein